MEIECFDDDDDGRICPIQLELTKEEKDLVIACQPCFKRVHERDSLVACQVAMGIEISEPAKDKDWAFFMKGKDWAFFKNRQLDVCHLPQTPCCELWL